MRYAILAAALCLAALPALAQEPPDPVEGKLVAEINAQATQNTHVIDAVRSLVEARAKDKADLAALREWVKQYFAAGQPKGP